MGTPYPQMADMGMLDAMWGMGSWGGYKGMAKGAGKGFAGKGTWDKPQVPKAPNANKVYVDFLAYKTTWETLKKHFSKAGTVVYAKVNCHPGMGGGANPHGWSKGNGLVAFSTPQEAVDAVNCLNGSELDGRTIAVSAWGNAPA